MQFRDGKHAYCSKYQTNLADVEDHLLDRRNDATVVDKTRASAGAIKAPAQTHRYLASTNVGDERGTNRTLATKLMGKFASRSVRMQQTVLGYSP